MSTQTKHYKQLTLGQRYQLSALLQHHLSQQAMADTLGVDKSTLSRELSKNGGKDVYCPEAAQQKAFQRKRAASKFSKVDDQHRQVVEHGLRLGWSPENISCRMKVELSGKAISHTSIYRMVENDKTKGGRPSAVSIRQ